MSARPLKGPSRTRSVVTYQSSTPAVSDEEFCRGLVDDIVEKILDDQFEKYHHEEVIPWTVEHIGDLLKEVLDFAFVDTDAGLDLNVESFFPDEALEDPQNYIDQPALTGFDKPVDEKQGVRGSPVLRELMEHRFTDISWQEDSENVIPVPPIDSWGTASIPVTQIIKVNCECEEGEAKEEEREKIAEGETLKGEKDAKKKRRKKKVAKEGTTNTAEVPLEASDQEEVIDNQTSKIPIYVPHPLNRHPYPWVGLSKSKKKTGRQKSRSPSRGRMPAVRGEGRGMGEQAACTCRKLCPPVIFKHMPHTTQSDIRAHYLGDMKDTLHCEACFGKPEMSEEKIEIGSGAVYLEKERLEPEKMAERFVQCGVRIPNRRRPPRGAVAGKDGKKPVKKPLAGIPPTSTAGASRKKLPPRLSLDTAVVDDPKDPLHKSRLIPNIALCAGVNVKGGDQQLLGPPFPRLSSSVKPENREFFATFDIDRRKELARVKSKNSSKFLTRSGTPRVRMSLPKLKPDVNLIGNKREKEEDGIFGV